VKGGALFCKTRRRKKMGSKRRKQPKFLQSKDKAKGRKQKTMSPRLSLSFFRYQARAPALQSKGMKREEKGGSSKRMRKEFFSVFFF